MSTPEVSVMYEYLRKVLADLPRDREDLRDLSPVRVRPTEDKVYERITKSLKKNRRIEKNDIDPDDSSDDEIEVILEDRTPMSEVDISDEPKKVDKRSTILLMR